MCHAGRRPRLVRGPWPLPSPWLFFHSIHQSTGGGVDCHRKRRWNEPKLATYHSPGGRRPGLFMFMLCSRQVLPSGHRTNQAPSDPATPARAKTPTRATFTSHSFLAVYSCSQGIRSIELGSCVDMMNFVRIRVSTPGMLLNSSVLFGSL